MYLSYAFSIYGEEIDRIIAHTIGKLVDNFDYSEMHYISYNRLTDMPDCIGILEKILLDKICTKI